MTAQQVLTALFNVGIAVSVGITVLSLGLSFTVRQLVAPLHRVVLVIAMVVLNAGVIPAAAWGIAEIMPMDSKYVPGLVLATLGAGSAASLKAAQLAKRADLPLAVSVVVVLQLVDIVAVPLVGRAGGHRRVDQCVGHREELAVAGAAAAGGWPARPGPLRRSRPGLAGKSW